MDEKEKIREIIKSTEYSLGTWVELIGELQKREDKINKVKVFLEVLGDNKFLTETIKGNERRKLQILMPLLEKVAPVCSKEVTQILQSVRKYYIDLDYLIPKTCSKLEADHCENIIRPFLETVQKGQDNYILDLYFEELIQIIKKSLIKTDSKAKKFIGYLTKILVKARENPENKYDELITNFHSNHFYKQSLETLLAISNKDFKVYLFKQLIDILETFDDKGFIGYVERNGIEVEDPYNIRDFILNKTKILGIDIIKNNPKINIFDYLQKFQQRGKRNITLERLYWYYTVKAGDIDRAIILAGEKDHFNNRSLHTEYFELLKVFYQSFPLAIKNNINSWVIEKLNQKKYRDSKILAIADFAEGKLLQEYQALKHEINLIEKPALTDWTEISWGSRTAPFYEEFKQKSVEEIINFFKNLQFDNAIRSSYSQRELSKSFEQLVSDYHEKFLDSIQLLKGIEGIYILSFLKGIQNIIYQISLKEWEKLFHLINLIIYTHGFIVKNENTDEINNDFSWQNIKHEIVRIFDIVLTPGHYSALTLEFREEIFKLLTSLVNESDLTREEEEKHIKGSHELISLHNSYTSPLALKTIFNYGLWVFEQLRKNNADLRPRPDLYLEFVQWIEKFIYNPPIRLKCYWSVLGRYFPYYNALVTSVSDILIDQIFPINNEEYFTAAWSGYLSGGVYPNDNCFERLKRFYVFYLESGGDLRSQLSKFNEKIHTNIANHIIIYILKDLLDAKEILHLLLNPLNIEIAFSATIDLARFVKDLPIEYRQQYKNIWEEVINRYLESKLDAAKNPLYNFSWAFTDSSFDREWHFEKLTKIIHNIGNIRDPYFLLEKISKEKYWAVNSPILIIETVQRLFRSNFDFRHSSVKKVYEIMAQAKEGSLSLNEPHKSKFEHILGEFQYELGVLGYRPSK